MSIFSENMSEDKAIKVLDNYLSETYNEFTRCGAVGIPDEQWYATDRILDLYKQEKEKNKKDENTFIELGKVLGQKIYEDKIKAKIEEYKEMLKECNKAQDIDRIKALNERILFGKDLLEE